MEEKAVLDNEYQVSESCSRIWLFMEKYPRKVWKKTLRGYCLLLFFSFQKSVFDFMKEIADYWIAIYFLSSTSGTEGAFGT